MTEEQWIIGGDPIQLAEELFYRRTSDRKIRLFACACSAPFHYLVSDERFLALHRLAEDRADGRIGPSECESLRRELQVEFNRSVVEQSPTAADHVRDGILHAAWEPFSFDPAYYESEDNFPYVHWVANTFQFICDEPEAFKGEVVRQTALLRDVFGNPFRPVAVDPSWLTSTVVGLAEGIYADRAFDRLPVLADALEDAGCDNDDVLAHCREPGEHVRGCWVVDLVTGRA